jgi:crotonobetainyl-CoA:carnitine CoA-transferase CaiB-like acyl-CoA transferase
MPKILDGLRVLDLTEALAGPFCTRILADGGARVIKIERPGGELYRIYPHIREGQSSWWMYTNWGKKSISIDLKNAEGPQLIKELAKESDLIIENFRPGVLESYGLTYETFKAVNHSIIMCSISGFGQTGPNRSLMGADTAAQAYSGLLDMTGEPDGRPCFVGTAIGDYVGALYAFGAVCAALYHRAITGEGQYIDIALVDCLFSVHDFPVGAFILSEGKEEIHRAGPDHLYGCPLGVYKGTDGFIVINAPLNDAFARLLDVMGKPELINDPRFDSPEHRLEHREEVRQVLEEWLRNFEHVSEVANLLQSYRILGTPVLTVKQAIDDPQFQAREMLVELEHPTLGPIKVLNTPLRFSHAKSCVHGALAVKPGEHTKEILRSVLKLSQQQIEGLQKRKVVFAPE